MNGTFNIPVITWIFTAILLLSGIYHIVQATRSYQLTNQINYGLHALMHLLMVAMLWHLAASIMLAQILVLSVAALWFMLQAVARAEVKTLCTDDHSRLKCAYHSLSMVGAALMIAMMGGVTTSGYAAAPTSEMSMPHEHHTMAAPTKTTVTENFGHSPDLALLLTVFFAAAAIVFIILLLRYKPTKNTHHNSAATKLTTHKEHGLEALGAAIMALMFATMVA